MFAIEASDYTCFKLQNTIGLLSWFPLYNYVSDSFRIYPLHIHIKFIVKSNQTPKFELKMRTNEQKYSKTGNYGCCWFHCLFVKIIFQFGCFYWCVGTHPHLHSHTHARNRHHAIHHVRHVGTCYARKKYETKFAQFSQSINQNHVEKQNNWTQKDVSQQKK